jgi:hypothetical protein
MRSEQVNSRWMIVDWMKYYNLGVGQLGFLTFIPSGIAGRFSKTICLQSASPFLFLRIAG